MYAKVYLFSDKMLAVADNYSFAQWLEKEMTKKEMSQAQLAREAGVTRSAINGILSGRRGPGPDLCKAIAVALDLPQDLVFEKAGLFDPSHELTEREKQMMHIFHQLPTDVQDMYIAMGESTIGLHKKRGPRGAEG